MTLLAGDIGGTKTLLQIAAGPSQHAPLDVLYERNYPSADYPVFDELLADFLAAAQQAGVPKPTLACIAVAGPVMLDGQGETLAKVTNLPWLLSVKKLAAQFMFKQLRLMNDFQAVGYGLEALTDAELLTLQKGEASPQPLPLPRVVIGAGTGLGQGLLLWRGDAVSGYYDVLASEGGHCEFAPANLEQLEVAAFLLRQPGLTKQPGRVCVEDVLSGRGLVNLYHYFADKYPAQVNAAFTQAMAERDAAAVISEAALGAEDPLAERALELFVAIYAGQAGNLALTCLALGGVFIAGGIAPKIRSRLDSALFLQAFQNKGPMTELMKKMPVKLVTNPQVGLKGALQVASRL